MSVPGTDLQAWRWLRGRASRREYLLWVVVIGAWTMLFTWAGDVAPQTVLVWVLVFAFVRRLHDIGYGAEWLLAFYLAVLTFTIAAAGNPGAGYGALAGLLTLVFIAGLGVWPGQRGENRFGPPPGAMPTVRNPGAAPH